MQVTCSAPPLLQLWGLIAHGRTRTAAGSMDAVCVSVASVDCGRHGAGRDRVPALCCGCDYGLIDSDRHSDCLPLLLLLLLLLIRLCLLRWLLRWLCTGLIGSLSLCNEQLFRSALLQRLPLLAFNRLQFPRSPFHSHCNTQLVTTIEPSQQYIHPPGGSGTRAAAAAAAAACAT